MVERTAAPEAGAALAQVVGPPRARARARARAGEDLFVAISRRLVYVALVFLPLLRYRAGKAFDLSDAIFVSRRSS